MPLFANVKALEVDEFYIRPVSGGSDELYGESRPGKEQLLQRLDHGVPQRPFGCFEAHKLIEPNRFDTRFHLADGQYPRTATRRLLRDNEIKFSPLATLAVGQQRRPNVRWGATEGLRRGVGHDPLLGEVFKVNSVNLRADERQDILPNCVRVAAQSQASLVWFDDESVKTNDWFSDMERGASILQRVAFGQHPTSVNNHRQSMGK